MIELAQELSGRTYEADEATTRAMRILADHTRGMSFLLAEGVYLAVSGPSFETPAEIRAFRTLGTWYEDLPPY